MKKLFLFLFVFILCGAQISAEAYTTLIHHKDGRVFAVETNQIDSITHITDWIDNSYYDLTDSIIYPPHMNAMMGTLLQAQAGIPNSMLCNEENKEALFSQNADYQREGTSWTHVGMFSLIDDDLIDQFIPSCYGSQHISNSDKRVGGYFSLLYPFLKSLEIKHGIPLTCGLAVEGHRVGFTGFSTPTDNCSLNENGRLAQQLVSHANWECLCHSMTAMISPDGSLFLVDSLTSPDAIDILANGKWAGNYSFYTAGVYDKKTKKNYTVSSDHTQWKETPLKYIQPYYFDKKTNKWIYNESYPVDYQVGEWKRRADSIGFTYEDIMVHWANTTTSPIIRDSRRFFSTSVDPGMGNGVNNVPLGSTIHRITTISGNDNAYSTKRYNELKNAVDNAFASKGWLVLMSHFYLVNYYNGYLDDVDYPEIEDEYNQEWINPLVYEEIISMTENNYWENPPARLGISNWGEWRPAKGTQLWALYQIFEYAIGKGLQNVSPSKGVEIIGNKVNIGTYRDQGLYPREKNMQLMPIDNCYYVVGADGSIKYHSEK